MKFIDPWGSGLVEDYEKIIKDFGLEVFSPSLFPEPNKIMRRGVVFAGRDLKRISDCIKNKKKFYALSGIMPSNDKIHFGNKLVVENLKYFQEMGAKTYILIADLESSATRDISLEEAQKRALDFHIPAYIALGLDPKKTVFYFQSENRKVMNLGYEFVKKVTLNEFKGIYGQAEPSRIMSAVLQAGDMLFPQLEEKMPGIIPVGIDQDPHIRLCRDIVARTKSRFDFFPVSSIYHKYTPSLDGSLKMSKSKPSACIVLPEEVKSAGKKIKSAKTGGRETVEEQKKLGGIPEECMIFELYKQHLFEDDDKLQDVFNRCKKGLLTCGEDKKYCVDCFGSFMDDFNSKLDKARKIVDKLNFLR
jgi:tryptophanyl-tRNA synthetase